MKDTCIMVYDLLYGIEFINSRGAALLGKQPFELHHLSLAELARLEGIQAVVSRIEGFISRGSPAFFLERMERPPKDALSLEIWLFAMRNRNREPKKVWVIMHDVSEKARVEHQIRHSLQEKEILLREIHHRVKNNLQQIAGLLYLQEKHIANPDAVAILQESRNRIYSMALAHEVLYCSGDMVNVNLSVYFSQLIGHLKTSYGTGQRDIRIRTQIDPDVSLPLDVCILCGIIINELVSNALKHAFEEKSSGEIGIVFSGGPQTCSLSVSDNGNGMPATVSLEYPATLGLLLVRNLARHLNGTLTLQREGGTVVMVEFPAGR